MFSEFDPNDRAYLQRRLQDSERMAQASREAGVADVHRRMAQEYARRINNAGLDS